MDELDLYDRTRCELQTRLRDRFPLDIDLESATTAYAYWVCTVVRDRGKDWAEALTEYVDKALRSALEESRAERAEVELLRHELSQATGPLLDVGAGWGRLSSLYSACGLQAVYVEPAALGCQLMGRDGLARAVRCPGQHLSFPTSRFNTAVITWVLHHDAPDVPSKAIACEIARVVSPGGRVFSVEPLSADFGMQQWKALFEGAGFWIDRHSVFFEATSDAGRREEYAFLIAVRDLPQQRKDPAILSRLATPSRAMPLGSDAG